MKKPFETPELTVEHFSVADVIATSVRLDDTELGIIDVSGDIVAP